MELEERLARVDAATGATRDSPPCTRALYAPSPHGWRKNWAAMVVASLTGVAPRLVALAFTHIAIWQLETSFTLASAGRLVSRPHT